MKTTMAVFVTFAAAMAAHAAVIEQVIVRQQWPWSTDVKVEYTLSDVSSPVDVSVRAYNGAAPLDSAKLASSISGVLHDISEGGVYSFTIDPLKAFGTEKVALSDFRVALDVAATPASMYEVLYKIFCLTNGVCTDITRAELLNGKYGPVVTDFGEIGDGYRTSLTNVLIWTGVTNDVAYKTTHLVMRKIPAADEVWQIGSPSSEPGRAVNDTEAQKWVKLTQDFYIGVFPVTYAQFKAAGSLDTTASASQAFKEEADSDYHPVNNVPYSTVRGDMSGTWTTPGGAKEKINWPTNSYLHAVRTENYKACYCNDLRKKFGGVEFDIPFDPQWEFACRAGVYDKGLNDGLGLVDGAETSDRLDALGWYKGNAGGKTHAVGQKRPNAFGLYDMHGNICEMLANWYGNVENATSGSGATKDDPLVDPVGVVRTAGSRSMRGGYFSQPPGRCRNAWRGTSTDYYKAATNQGFRVVCPVGTTWE